MHKTLQVMHATEMEGVELASYHLKEVAYSWFELWEESREEGIPPARWGEFTDAFMDHFLPAETKAARATEFESLKQGNMCVWDYHMEFARLSKYAIHMLPTIEARVHRFVQGLIPLVINEATTTALNSDIRPALRGGSSGPSQSFTQSSMNEQPSGPSVTVESVQVQLGQQGTPQAGDFRSSRRIMGRGAAQQASSAATTSKTPPPRGTPSPAGHGAARGGAQNSGGPSRLYVMRRRRDSEASPDVVTGILTVQSYDVYAFIDLGSTLSYITPYVAMEFGIEPE
ncbi:uncharacterized protein [Nicotiana tomentosiformis]|uniref:uncharacterized protein n=1 Tax=Nicotiana tomentosiformis TaxID=4098 RepID=UPI00388CAA25